MSTEPIEQKKSIEHPSGEAFLTNPVASVNDRTGYVQTPPETESQAQSYSELMNVPVSEDEPHGEKSKKRNKRKNR